jgi:hypothetical protein
VKQAEAGKEANADKRDAEYRVAIEKCDAGPAKETCVSTAKTQYGQSPEIDQVSFPRFSLRAA